MTDVQSKVDNLRDTANTLRRVAARMTPGSAQTEIMELAERFERLAEHAERRSPATTDAASFAALRRVRQVA